MFEEINNYSQWNKTLWAYFFPEGTENPNPIIYLDENIIKNIGTKIGGDIEDYQKDFLSKTLLNKDDVAKFANDWFNRTGCHIPIQNNTTYRKDLKKWTFEDLVLFLMQNKLEGLSSGKHNSYEKYFKRGQDAKIPAYFGMLCAIMYLACTEGASHDRIKGRAKCFLGNEYKNKVGELIDDLFERLHKDVQSFDPNRMICGTQRNMSRIKFHSLLKTSDYDDFIDFIEINNLKWEYESYSEFINYRLIPALNRASKRHFIEFVTKKDNIPYVKSILQRNLNYGKTESTKNKKQQIDIVWKYEMYFNSYDGSLSFYISPNTFLPFGLSINNNKFIVDENNLNSDYIAEETDFIEYETQYVLDDTYCIKNVGNNWNEIIFKRVSDGIYHQVSELHDGYNYIKFVKEKKICNKSTEWSPSTKSINIKGYSIYEISDYKYTKKNASGQSDKVDDAFSLNGVGSWFSIYLKDSQKIYWDPDKLDSKEEKEKIVAVECIIGDNNKYYFQLPRTSDLQISGKLIVSSDELKTRDVNEPILDNFEWDGEAALYFINGWGEVSKTECMKVDESSPNRRELLQDNRCSNIPTSKSDMLIQILYDVADKNGCVSQKKLVAAIDFVFGAYNINPTPQNRRSVIYALKRLGYMTSFYNHITRLYENQLIPSFLELSNYSLSNSTNAYLIKGIYDYKKLDSLLKKANYIRYKRPYDEATLNFNPEYIVIPDLILIETQNVDGWKCYNQPIATSLIKMMGDITEFEQHFGIESGGDIYVSAEKLDKPCMIKDKYGKEILCTESPRGSITHKTYFNNEYMDYIPKHLSRAYCQYKKNQPICIMQNNLNGDIDLSSITFISGMAKPQILDMALCDLNLGLPNFEYIFIVNQNEIIQQKYAFIEGRSYSTHATSRDNGLLKTAIVKLSGRNVNEFSNSTAIYVSRNRRHANGYQMKLFSDSNYAKYLVLLTQNSEIVVLSKSNKITYALNPQNKLFQEIVGNNSTNEKISDYINGKTLEYGKVLENFDTDCFNGYKSQPVRIIIKS